MDLEKPVPLIYKVTLSLYIAAAIVLLSFWFLPDNQCVESMWEQPPGGCWKAEWLFPASCYIMVTISDVIKYRKKDVLEATCRIHDPRIYRFRVFAHCYGFFATMTCGMMLFIVLIISIVFNPATVTLSFISQTRMIGFLAINILAYLSYIPNAARFLKRRTVQDVDPREMSSKNECCDETKNEKCDKSTNEKCGEV